MLLLLLFCPRPRMSFFRQHLLSAEPVPVLPSTPSVSLLPEVSSTSVILSALPVGALPPGNASANSIALGNASVNPPISALPDLLNPSVFDTAVYTPIDLQRKQLQVQFCFSLTWL
jgi:hypothetical protein